MIATITALLALVSFAFATDCPLVLRPTIVSQPIVFAQQLGLTTPCLDATSYSAVSVKLSARQNVTIEMKYMNEIQTAVEGSLYYPIATDEVSLDLSQIGEGIRKNLYSIEVHNSVDSTLISDITFKCMGPVVVSPINVPAKLVSAAGTTVKVASRCLNRKHIALTFDVCSILISSIFTSM